jgi:4-hydroxy-tetrahydrodipicolinate synthase
MSAAPQREPSTFVISITPFDASLRLDEGALRAHYARLAASGIGVYVGGAGSGEGYTLSAAERRRVLEIAAEELKGKIPVRAMGVEPRTPQEMIEFASLVAEVGLDAMQVYSLDMGHGFGPNRAEMLAYYEAVLGSGDLPVVISTHQSVGYFLPTEMLVALAQRFPRVIGINCTSPDITYLEALATGLPEHVTLHVGGPMQALTALALGASGYLSSDANVAPQLAMEVVNAWGAGAYATSHAAFATLIRLFAVLSHGGGISATKCILSGLGLPGGLPRPPRLPISDPAAAQRLIAAVRTLEIPELQGSFAGAAA